MSPKPPEGYRLLEEGERYRKTDLVRRPIGGWGPVVGWGGKWRPDRYYPMARKIEEKPRISVDAARGP